MSYPVTEKELADRLQCSRRKVAMWRHEGLLIGVKISQGWAYSEKQINTFFDRYANLDISTIDQCRKVKKKCPTGDRTHKVEVRTPQPQF